MKQLSKHQVNKLTAKEIQKLLPFQILADGEVIAVVLPMQDFKTIRKKDRASMGPSKPRVAKLSKPPGIKESTKTGTELKFSKQKQAQNLLPGQY